MKPSTTWNYHFGGVSLGMPKVPKITLQYLQKNMWWSRYFDCKKVFYKLIVTLWLGIVRHAQSTQNNKFAISLQYLEKEMSDQINFLHAYKHESLLRIDTIILIGMVKHFGGFQNNKFLMSLYYLKKEVRDEVDFSNADKRSF